MFLYYVKVVLFGFLAALFGEKCVHSKILIIVGVEFGDWAGHLPLLL